MGQKIKKIWNMATTVLVVAIIVPVLFLSVLPLFGIKGFTVLSGSMEPVYKTGSVIYVKAADTDQLQKDDVITFYATGKTIATHRIVEVLEEDGVRRFRTKGDANDIADGSPVDAGDVIGTPIFSIPYLGYALTYIQSPPGTYVALAVGAGLLLLVFLPSLIFDEGKNKPTNQKEVKQ